jgi:hypothetical protein
MTEKASPGILDEGREKLLRVPGVGDLLDAPVVVEVRPVRRQGTRGPGGNGGTAAVTGERVLIEAAVDGTTGEAFADSAEEFSGSLREAFEVPLDTESNRAVFLATANAALHRLGHLDEATHCREHLGRTCGDQIASIIWDRWGDVPVALIGLNPRIAESLIETFGPANIRLADLDPEKVGTVLLGVEIRDAEKDIETIMQQARIAVVSGTLMVKGAFDRVHDEARRRRRFLAVYGATGAGICSLLEINRVCPNARED